MATTIESALANLSNPTPLSIHALSEPILSTTPSANQSNSPTTRSSPSTTTTFSETQDLTPSLLSSDLTHHKSLFSKLRFSYTTQVTKEKFLKSIITVPSVPQSSSTQISALEPILQDSKTALKGKKRGVEDELSEIEGLARRVARKHAATESQVALLAALPNEIGRLEARIENAREAVPARHPSAEMNLGLAETGELLEERTAGAERMEARIGEVREAVRLRRIEVEALREEVGGLEDRKRGAVEEAREARRRRGKGGDAVELRGRWARGCDGLLRGLLELEA